MAKHHTVNICFHHACTITCELSTPVSLSDLSCWDWCYAGWGRGAAAFPECPPLSPRCYLPAQGCSDMGTSHQTSSPLPTAAAGCLWSAAGVAMGRAPWTLTRSCSRWGTGRVPPAWIMNQVWEMFSRYNKTHLWDLICILSLHSFHWLCTLSPLYSRLMKIVFMCTNAIKTSKQTGCKFISWYLMLPSWLWDHLPWPKNVNH